MLQKLATKPWLEGPDISYNYSTHKLRPLIDIQECICTRQMM